MPEPEFITYKLDPKLLGTWNLVECDKEHWENFCNNMGKSALPLYRMLTCTPRLLPKFWYSLYNVDLSNEITMIIDPNPPTIEITADADGTHYTLKETGGKGQTDSVMKSTKTHVEVTFNNKAEEYTDRDVLGACLWNFSKTRKAKFLFLNYGVLFENRRDPRFDEYNAREELRYQVQEDGRLSVHWHPLDSFMVERFYKKRA